MLGLFTGAWKTNNRRPSSANSDEDAALHSLQEVRLENRSDHKCLDSIEDRSVWTP